MPESTDRLLSGRYRLIEPIGRGGMGTVWWAHDEETDREVAVKEVHLPDSLDPIERSNRIKRTHREALTAGRLHHPGLVAVHDVMVEGDQPWLIMEYIPARSLEQVFVDAPISPRRVAEIGVQLLAGLRCAHDAGIMHRDVKPSNVLLGTSGRVVLTDFGIATFEGATTLTRSGTFMGSPSYVAPEVARGDKATPASDLWSLGATLYAAVEGRPPYDHDTAMATLGALLTSEPDPPRQAGAMRPVLDALLRKDPAKRATADQVEELLETAVQEVPENPPSRRSDAARAGRDRLVRIKEGMLPSLTGAIVAVALAMGLILVVDDSTPHQADVAGAAAPSPTPTKTGSPRPTSEHSRKALPTTLLGPAGRRPVGRLAAREGGRWPTRTFVALRVPTRYHRVGVTVVCPGVSGQLAFTARVAGGTERIEGNCTAHARPTMRKLRLPAGTKRTTIRFRLTHRSGVTPPRRAEWTAAVYRMPGD